MCDEACGAYVEEGDAFGRWCGYGEEAGCEWEDGVRQRGERVN